MRQVNRNCKKNIISGPLYKYDKLRNNQHDFYVGLPWSSLVESPAQSNISCEVRPENSVSEYEEKVGSFYIIFDFKDALSKFIYLFYDLFYERAIRWKILQRVNSSEFDLDSTSRWLIFIKGFSEISVSQPMLILKVCMNRLVRKTRGEVILTVSNNSVY